MAITTTMSNRVATWDRIGSEITAVTLQDALVQSNLDFTVTKQPLFTLSTDGLMKEVPTHAACIGSNDINYGVVKKSYKVIDNIDAFSIAEDLCKEGDLRFVRGGTLKTHRASTFLILEMPKFSVLHDDVKLYFILQNSFDGQQALKASIVPLRIVCQNQFKIAFRESPNTITIRHCGNVQGRLDQAREILGYAGDYAHQFAKYAERLSMEKIGKKEVDRFLSVMFPAPADPGKGSLARNEVRISDFLQCYKAEDNKNFTGTAWGLLNAWADYSTHSVGFKQKASSADRKFEQSIASGSEKAVKALGSIIHIAA